MSNTTIHYKDPVILMSRVLGMFLIVLCHIIKYYSFIPAHQLLGQFFGCGVYLFFFISGYLYGGKTITHFKIWYAKRIIAIAMPAIVLGIITIAALSFCGEIPSAQAIIAYCLNLQGLPFLSWKLFGSLFREIISLGPLWFTTIIMICYLLVPILQKSTQKDAYERTTSLTVFFITLGCLVSLLLSQYISLCYCLLFAIGYCAGKRKFLERIDSKKFLLYSIGFVVALLGRLIMHKYFDNTYIYIQYTIFANFVLGTWFVILFAFFNKLQPMIMMKASNSKMLRLIDSYSFYIYLVHGVFCAGAFNVFAVTSLSMATLAFIVCTIISAIALKNISGIISKFLLSRIKRA